MPKLCIELKGPDGSVECAKKQAADDGAVMVDSAWETYKFVSKPADEFLSRTKALTVAVNGSYLHIFANHAVAPQAAMRNEANSPAAATNSAPPPPSPILPTAKCKQRKNGRGGSVVAFVVSP
jgi:hypothetical protein